MIASRLGNAQAVKELIEAGANPELVNNAGLNAFQVVLEQACKARMFTEKKLGPI